MSKLYPPTADPPLSTAEAADLLGCTARDITYHANRGRFPHAFRTLGLDRARGRWRIPRGDVEAVRGQLKGNR